MKKVNLTLLVFTFLLYGFLNNSFAQWAELTSGTTRDLESISSPDNNICWVSGDSGTVVRTTNGGLNWQNVGVGLSGSNSIHNIFAVDANIAILTSFVGTNAVVFRTTNGGSNWLQVFSQPDGYINSIWMTSASNGFMMGDPVDGRWSLWKTTNGGVNWDSAGLKVNQIGTEYGWNNGMFVLGNQIWFGTFSPRLYYSSNNGADWSIQTTSESYGHAAVWFNSPQNGMSSGYDIAYSSNSGNTWDIRNLQNNFIMGIMGKGNNFWDCEFNPPSRIQMTSNGGLDWIVEYQPAVGQLNHITASRNGNTGWACMTSGIIAKRMSLVNIATQNSEIPKQFSLSQNYPNPFNPSTKINFDIPANILGMENVSLKIYDILGHEVETLINAQLKPGSYTAEWNAGNFSSGVYYYRITAGQYSDTRKMLLVK
jgi:hypothetical protein